MAAVIVGAAFTTCIAAEVFAHAFRPYSGLPRVYLWVVLAVVALASGIIFRICNVKVSYLSATERGIQFAGVVGFAFTLLLSRYLCSPIRQHVFGIAIGFLLYVSAQYVTGMFTHRASSEQGLSSLPNCSGWRMLSALNQQWWRLRKMTLCLRKRQ
jgi:hypothetical protein